MTDLRIKKKETTERIIEPIIFKPKETVEYKISPTSNVETEEIPLIKPENLYSKRRYTTDENGMINLIEIHPDLQEKMDLLVEKCKEEGIYIKVTETLRTVEEQNEKYKVGRNENGEIVDPSIIITNANGSEYKSKHQWGIAFDICINEKKDPYNREKLNRAGEIGKELGLEWGGDWETFTDRPHFQLKGYDNVQELIDKYGDPGKYSETWDE